MQIGSTLQNECRKWRLGLYCASSQSDHSAVDCIDIMTNIPRWRGVIQSSGGGWACVGILEIRISIRFCTEYIQDIYFFEVNTKCKSPNVMKILVN